jgi:predicted O-methyltransferase YrrM
MYRHRHVWMRFGLFRRPVLHYRTTSTSASQPVTPKDKEEGIRQLPMSILTSYLQRYTTPEDQIECSPCHASLARATAEQFPRFAGQAVSAMQGRFLRMLVRAMGAKRVLELGCFTGQSALWMMEGMLLGAGSSSPVQLVTCEIDAKRAQVAREWIDRAQLSKYIQLYEGPAQIM